MVLFVILLNIVLLSKNVSQPSVRCLSSDNQRTVLDFCGFLGSQLLFVFVLESFVFIKFVVQVDAEAELERCWSGIDTRLQVTEYFNKSADC